MKWFASTLPRNFAGCFKGRMALWHLAAIAVTLLLVLSGFDWRYYEATRSATLRTWMFPAVHVGGLLPILLPIMLLVSGAMAGDARLRRTGWAVAQGEIIGGVIVIGYKALTGRAHPLRAGNADLSHVFQFGFLRGGVFWGWPSSHTTIAFAMAVVLCVLYPRPRWLRWLALAYAFYVGIGVSMTIHWLSAFVAGAVVGAVGGAGGGKSAGAVVQSQAASG